MWFKSLRVHIIYIFVLFNNVYCEPTEEPSDTLSLVRTYKSYVNASHDLDRSDRAILATWTTDFQLQLVNVTAQYRLDMTRHKEHSFMLKNNAKWKSCLDFHRIEINNSEKSYLESESKCLRAANAEESKGRHSVYQLEKEIRKWRKSFRYLMHQCNMENPGDEEAAAECLVLFMQHDNYYMAFQRLILLKLEAMSNLYAQILTSLKNCEECLKTNLSNYLTAVRNIMIHLNKCYKIIMVREAK